MDKAIITEAYELTGNKPTNNHISEYAKKTNTDISVGLSTDEAKKRLLEQGQNVLKQEKAESVFKIILQQFKDLLNVMLSFIAIADFASLPFMGDKKEDHLIQGIVIAVIVFFNVALSVYQEVKASKALDALKNTCTPIAKVMRDGKIQTINAKELVYGDVVYLEDGVIVPADLFLVETNSLKIEEGALTGESLPVEKDALVDTKENVALGDKVNYAFTSTMVTYGSGIGIVCSTGMHTEIGKIATMLTDSGNSKDLPPLKKKINKLVKILTIFAIALLVVMFVINGILFAAHIYPGFLSGNGDSYTYKFWMSMDTIICTIALGVSLVPVALPVTTTVVLSISVSRMAKRNALCKELTIVETIGNASVICSDKTGTLTMNKMTVTAMCNYEDIVKQKNKTPKEVKEDFKTYKHLISIGMFCNNAVVEPNNPDTFIGDPTEAALLILGEETELDLSKTRDKYKRIYEQPFDSTRKLMTTVYETKNGYVSFTKGAAERIVDLCSYIETKHGIREITSDDRKIIKDYLNIMSSNALRVLGMASRQIKDTPVKGDNFESEMTFKGVVGMIDPPRPEVAEAIKICHEANVRVAMITGDHQITALAIARDIGIVDENDSMTLTGVEL